MRAADALGSIWPKTSASALKPLRSAKAIALRERELQPAKPAGKVGGNKTAADLVVENHE